MKFGIITPVFDGCFESIKLLARDIELQTHNDWVWMLCSNGYSGKYSAFVEARNSVINQKRSKWARLRDKYLGEKSPQLIYRFIEPDLEDGFISIFENVCKRRNYCINEIQSDYICMIDADAKILERDMFKILDNELKRNQKKNLCIYKIKHSELGELPIFPIGFAKIDLLNYCIKTSLAKELGYPTRINLEAVGNDYWFLDSALSASKGDYLFIDMVFAEHNGNSTYRSLGNIQRSFQYPHLV